MLPIWELLFTKMPEETSAASRPSGSSGASSTRRSTASSAAEAKELPEGAAARIQAMCKRVYRSLMLTGYARIDLRLRDDGSMCVIEANPNPQLSRDEDFALSARAMGVEYERLIQRLLVLGMRWEPSSVG